MTETQKVLSAEQTQEFYHDHFVADQVGGLLRALGPSLKTDDLIVDIGGGCGYFARALTGRASIAARVMDTDPASIAACLAAGTDAQLADALVPAIRGDETIACFNMVLHHLVGASDAQTRALQVEALRSWRSQVRYVFVNEYVYESFGSPGWSGKLIWSVTSSRMLSALAKLAAKVLPSLRANTLGVGVRFRPVAEWLVIFKEAGYELTFHELGEEESIPVPRRALLIRSTRRDNFVLRPLAAQL